MIYVIKVGVHVLFLKYSLLYFQKLEDPSNLKLSAQAKDYVFLNLEVFCTLEVARKRSAHLSDSRKSVYMKFKPLCDF